MRAGLGENASQGGSYGTPPAAISYEWLQRKSRQEQWLRGREGKRSKGRTGAQRLSDQSQWGGSLRG